MSKEPQEVGGNPDVHLKTVPLQRVGWCTEDGMSEHMAERFGGWSAAVTWTAAVWMTDSGMQNCLLLGWGHLCAAAAAIAADIVIAAGAGGGGGAAAGAGAAAVTSSIRVPAAAGAG